MSKILFQEKNFFVGIFAPGESLQLIRVVSLRRGALAVNSVDIQRLTTPRKWINLEEEREETRTVTA
jgi:hypothetical protein